MVLFIALLPYGLQEINKQRRKEEGLFEKKKDTIVIPSPASTLNYTYVEFPMLNILLVKTLRTYAISAACSRLENLAKACV